MPRARRRWIASFGFSAAILTSALADAGASAQATRSTPPGAIVGVVTDSALRPIADADVAVLFSTVHVATDARGGFAIHGMPDGSYLLSVRRVAMEPLSIGVEVRGDTARLSIVLRPRIQELASVTTTATVVSAKLEEFRARMRSGRGEFFDQRMIEQRNVVAAFDLIRQARAVRLTSGGGAVFAFSARQHTPCPMQIYVDGIPLAGSGPNMPFDLTQLPSPKEIAGIEIYAGDATTPIWLPKGPSGGRLGCGAVLVWTRDGSGGPET